MQYIQEVNNIFSKDTKILQEFSNIFQRKCSQNHNIVPDEQFIAMNVTKRLNVEERLRLDADIEMSELTEALNSMKKGKTPGSNGFPVEFFRCFWHELGPFLHRALKTSFKDGRGLPTHR